MIYIYLAIAIFLSVTLLPQIFKYLDIIYLAVPPLIFNLLSLAVVVSCIVWLIGRDH